MTIEDLIRGAQERLNAAIAERATHTTRLTEMRSRMESGDATVTEDAVRGVIAERTGVDARIDQLRARVADLETEKRQDDAINALQREVHPAAVRPAYDQVARIGAEPVTYSMRSARQDGVSFFQDAYRAQYRSDWQARERIDRHQRETAAEAARLQERATTTSSFAGLVVPQYIVEEAAIALRNGRPLANLIRHDQIPAAGDTFQVPRGTTGASTAIQNGQNTQLSITDEVWANVTVPVCTIGGQQQVSRQSLERGFPGLDQLVYADLVGAYAANVDTQVIQGTGAAGQVLGLQNTAGISAATLFGAAPTAANFSSKVAGQIAAIAGAGTAIQPRVVAMHPRRWGWLQSLADTTGRPLAIANPLQAFNALGMVTMPGAYGGDGSAATGTGGPANLVGVLANGLPVVTDANIPITVGTNSEDLVFVLDTRAHILWEDGDGMPRQLTFEQAPVTSVVGTSLTTTLAVYGYVAFTAGRYPGATGKVGGLDSTATFGLVAPSF